MKSISTALLALVSLATVSEAKVLIFKGNFVSKTGPLNIRLTTCNYFLVLDPDANQVEIVSFFVRDGKKLQAVDSPLNIKIASATTTAGRTTSTISLDTSTPVNGAEFANGIFYLRGTATTLKVSTTGLTTLNFPRVLTGTNLSTGLSQGIGFFAEQRFVMSYQDALTIKANDASQTIVAAGQTLSDFLKTKGFLK
jgi:hypothetical protein